MMFHNILYMIRIDGNIPLDTLIWFYVHLNAVDLLKHFFQVFSDSIFSRHIHIKVSIFLSMEEIFQWDLHRSEETLSGQLLSLLSLLECFVLEKSICVELIFITTLYMHEIQHSGLISWKMSGYCLPVRDNLVDYIVMYTIKPRKCEWNRKVKIYYHFS